MASPGPESGGQARHWSQMGGSAERSAEQQAADRVAGFFPLTDLGNTERWHHRHGQDFRHAAEIGWLAWDGRRWSREHAETRLMDSVFDTVRSIQFEAAARRQAGEAWAARRNQLDADLASEAIDAEQHAAAIDRLGPCPDPVISVVKDKITLASDKLGQWGRTSENQARIMAVATIARSLVGVRLEELDADPWLFNVMNGTLRIRRFKGAGCVVKLGPHRRDDLMTMLAPVVYDPDATCPTYDAFLARVHPDEAVRQYLHAYAGYALTGDTGEQKFLINYGPLGANGKSTWVDQMARMWGDYALTVSIDVFMDTKMRNSASPSPDLAELPRKRLVTTSEPERGKPFAEAMVKLVTGGEPIQARHLNMPFFRFIPEFKIIVSTNPMPPLSSDAAIWRRTDIVGWNVSIPEAERDADLKAKLWAEASGVLNRVIEGLVNWGTEGLPKVDAVQAATADVRDVADPLARFLRMATVMDPTARAPSKGLYRAYLGWAAFDGAKAWSEKGFAAAMRDKGFAAIKASTMWWPGLRQVREADAFASVRGDGGWEARPDIGPRVDGVRDEWDAEPPTREDAWDGFPQ